ncbi:DegQ family serine endoprotease [Thioflexithrix psekupsensis]|nr:DegQ family serine endoprotease [Thioflexithrix psekupsensis]
MTTVAKKITRNGLMIGVLSVWCVLIFWNTSLHATNLPDFTPLVEQYGPAVVNISTSSRKTEENSEHGGGGRSLPELPEDSPFNEFFRRFFDEQPEGGFMEELPSTSLGSGFIISADGYVVTNNHVIEESGEIIVRLNDRREFVAQLIGADKRSDLALLKVEATDLPTVKLGSSSALKVGEWVLAIGSPFGFEYSVTAGIVSAKGRSLPKDTYVPFIQTDVAINPGNSGGPLFNMAGEVVGVNSQIYSRTGGFMGLSFAIPVDMMIHIVEQLKANGKVTRGWLGVLIQDVTRELAESFAMDKPQGALVAQVLPNSPAEAAGFQVGDIILKFNGKTIERSAELPPLVGMSELDKPAVAEVLRGSEVLNIDVIVSELPPEEEVRSAARGQGSSTTSNRMGVSVMALTPEQRKELNIAEDGVLVQKVERGPAQEAGIRDNDVIVMLDGKRVKDVKHFSELVSGLEAGRTVPVLINRRGNPSFLALKIPK